MVRRGKNDRSVRERTKNGNIDEKGELTKSLQEEGIVEVIVLDEVDPISCLLPRPLYKHVEGSLRRNKR